MTEPTPFANGGPVSIHVAPVGTPAPTASPGYALPSALIADIVAVHGFMHSGFSTTGIGPRHECTMAMLVNGATECTVCGRRGF